MREIETERVVTRNEAAEYLRQFADRLAEEGHQFGENATSETGTTGTTTTGTTASSTQQSSDRTADATGTEAGRTDATGTTQGESTDLTGGGATDASRNQGVDSTQGETTATTGEGATEERHHRYGKVTFLVGNDSATVNPPEEVTLGVEVGEDSSMMSSGAETVTFSLHWDKDTVPESDELRIE